MDDAAFAHAGDLRDRGRRADGCADRAALALLRRRPRGARVDCCRLAGPRDAADRRALAALVPAPAAFVPAAPADDDRGDRLDVARCAQRRWWGAGRWESRPLGRMLALFGEGAAREDYRA